MVSSLPLLFFFFGPLLSLFSLSIYLTTIKTAKSGDVISLSLPHMQTSIGTYIQNSISLSLSISQCLIQENHVQIVTYPYIHIAPSLSLSLLNPRKPWTYSDTYINTSLCLLSLHISQFHTRKPWKHRHRELT